MANSAREARSGRKPMGRSTKAVARGLFGTRKLPPGTQISAGVIPVAGGASVLGAIGGAVRRAFTSPVPSSAQPIRPWQKASGQVAGSASTSRPPAKRKRLRRVSLGK